MSNALSHELKKLIAKEKNIIPNGKKILITGAVGLISSVLTELLLQEGTNNVYAMARSEHKLSERFSNYIDKEYFHTIVQDVCSPIKIDIEFDYIIHGASLAHPLAFSDRPVDVMKANIVGAFNLLEYIINKSPKSRFLFLSTGEIYGLNDGSIDTFEEDYVGRVDTLNYRSCYPESKRSAETICISYTHQHNIDTVIARLCYIYGSTITDENSRADAQFLRNVLNNRDIAMKSTGNQIRSYCYVLDAVIALLYILKKGNKGEAYNVANNNSIASIREYAETLAKIGDVSINYEIPEEAERLGYSSVTRSVQNPHKVEQLGFKAKYSLEDGIKNMLDIAKEDFK